MLYNYLIYKAYFGNPDTQLQLLLKLQPLVEKKSIAYIFLHGHKVADHSLLQKCHLILSNYDVYSLLFAKCLLNSMTV